MRLNQNFAGKKSEGKLSLTVLASVVACVGGIPVMTPQYVTDFSLRSPVVFRSLCKFVNKAC